MCRGFNFPQKSILAPNVQENMYSLFNGEASLMSVCGEWGMGTGEGRECGGMSVRVGGGEGGSGWVLVFKYLL